ncbi:MAG: aldo/keto reductase [Spirochaetes bacterium]|nr:aldo/keto reductase [Spirochaetota bacterium]
MLSESKLKTAKLGNTGLTVTRFAAGGHFTNGPVAHEDIPRRVSELNHLLDLGVTYFDVQWEPEEIATAEIMKTRKDEFSVAWPLHGVTKLGGEITEKYILDYCDDHRARFGIQHVDILLWVALELYEDTKDKVMDVVRSAFSTLKSQGFCDYLAFSCHKSPKMAMYAITETDDFDVMMVPYCALHPAAGRELLKLAKEKGIGTVGMKPFGGGDGFFGAVWSGKVDHPEINKWHHSERPYEAAIRWVMQDENLDCTVPGAHSIQQIDQLFDAIKKPFTDEDKEILGSMKKVMYETDMKLQLKGPVGKPGTWD